MLAAVRIVGFIRATATSVSARVAAHRAIITVNASRVIVPSQTAASSMVSGRASTDMSTLTGLPFKTL